MVRVAAGEEGARSLLREHELPSAEHVKVMVVVAHPDDETIGLGGRLPDLGDVVIVHATDGAPEDMRDARRLGFETRRAYALARRAELVAAMAEAGVGRDALIELGVPDQTAARNLVALSRRIAELVRDVGPDIVVTHAYEGGHPDHDAVAFATHAAIDRLRRQGASSPPLFEMPLYRAERGRMAAQTFAASDRPEVVLLLSDAQRRRKQRMLGCFRTQVETLAAFSVGDERLRRAPDYDFLALPNGGELYYEQFPWGLDGSHWLTLARTALAELGSP